MIMWLPGFTSDYDFLSDTSIEIRDCISLGKSFITNKETLKRAWPIKWKQIASTPVKSLQKLFWYLFCSVTNEIKQSNKSKYIVQIREMCYGMRRIEVKVNKFCLQNNKSKLLLLSPQI